MASVFSKKCGTRSTVIGEKEKLKGVCELKVITEKNIFSALLRDEKFMN